MNDNTRRLKAMLEVAVEQGVLLFQGNEPATPEDIINVQIVNEDMKYMPEFIVKNDLGEIKEIWYGEVRHRVSR